MKKDIGTDRLGAFRRIGRSAAIVTALAMFGVSGCAGLSPAGKTDATVWTPSELTSRPAADVDKWESSILAFETADAISLPPPGGIVFVGSSSIVLWESLAEDMAPLEVVRRGFGGSRIYDAVHYSERIVLKYKPQAIVMFSGSNDITTPDPDGPARVEQGFIDFVAEARARYPGIDVHYIAITPSQARWTAYEQVTDANARIADLAAKDPDVYFIDTASAMMREGSPNDDLFRDDGLHLNTEGYAVWTSIIRPHLMELYGDAQE